MRPASRRGRSLLAVQALVLLLILLVSVAASAAEPATPPPVEPTAGTAPAGPTIQIDMGSEGYVGAIKVILMLGALSLAPTLILSMTSFVRIIVVLALLRQAVGVAQLPPTRVMVGLGLFLTFFTMTPVFERVKAEAIDPYRAGQMDEMEMVEAAMGPMRTFMLHHTREDDLGLFMGIMKEDRPATVDDVPTMALIPAFMLSELKTAFTMGALLFIPFLVIDLVVASVLMSMGMMMLPPATISLPLKLLVFVAVDGWGLVVTSLAEAFA